MLCMLQITLSTERPGGQQFFLDAAIEDFVHEHLVFSPRGVGHSAGKLCGACTGRFRLAAGAGPKSESTPCPQIAQQ